MFELPTGEKINAALEASSPLLLAMGQNMMAPPSQRNPNAMNQGIAGMMAMEQMKARRAQQAAMEQALGGVLGGQPTGAQPMPQGASGQGMAPQAGGLNIPPQLAALMRGMPPEQAMGVLADMMTQSSPQGTSAMQEYEFARGQGFEGTLLDFVNSRAAASRPVSNVTTNVNQASGGRYLTGTAAGLPPGWRFDVQTGVAEPIPGGPAAVEIEGQAVEAEQGVSQAASMLRSVQEIINDPALDTATGMLSLLQRIPGTPQYRFGTRARQLEGQAFLQAFESLKGGGQITEVEGQKATQAIGRLDTAQSAEDYREALGELEGILRDSVARRQTRADTVRTRGTQTQPEPAAPPATVTPETAQTVPYADLLQLDLTTVPPEALDAIIDRLNRGQ